MFSLTQLQSTLLADLSRLAPELTITGGILLLLLIRLVPRFDRTSLSPVAAMIVAAAVAMVVVRWRTAVVGDESFTGLLSVDPLACYIRGVVLLATLGVLLLSLFTGMPDRADSADFSVMILGSTLGLMLMASANHLLMVFLAIEMASLPSYALAGFRRESRLGSEAALKYVVLGAASAAVMLYGISLLAGSLGTGHLPTLAVRFGQAALHAEGLPSLATTGLVLMLVGIGFKLAIVPFQFWLPDVFEGATAEVGAYLSVASKAATVGLFARLLATLQEGLIAAGAEPTLLPRTLGASLAVAAGLTATFGNLAAMPQTNLKRLLAYSTIAHAGYMLMALATFTRTGREAVLFYLPVYLVMNLGAFAVVALVRTHTGSETLEACRGLLTRSPALGIVLTIFVMSLLGVPPLAGFLGKFLIFAAVYDAGQFWSAQGIPGIHTGFAVLLGVAVLNTALSAGYYLKVLRSAGLDDPPAGAGPLGESWGAVVWLGSLAGAVVGLGLWWGGLVRLASEAAPGG